MDEIKDQEIKNHEYDGIKEYDNPLPNWWLMTFFATIIFAFIYFLHYEFGGGETQEQELKAALSKIEELKNQTTTVTETPADLEAQLKDPKIAEIGARIYTVNCQSCHGGELQGMIGPNLTDKYWLHGKGLGADIVDVVKKGVLDKGMPAWGSVLSAQDIVAVSAFVLSKHGTQPTNAKAPQGELVP